MIITLFKKKVKKALSVRARHIRVNFCTNPSGSTYVTSYCNLNGNKTQVEGTL